MHAVVPRLLLVVGQARDGEKGNAVVGLVVGRPGGAVVSELNFGADDRFIPGDHLVEPGGFECHVVQWRGNSRGRAIERCPYERSFRSSGFSIQTTEAVSFKAK